MTKVFLYSHTHWDREWYLAQRQFQFHLGRTLDEIINLLEEDHRFRAFVADGQTSLLEDYFEVRPTARERVLRLLHAGRLVIGPWFTMPDIWIPDGESLIRNLLQGRLDCEQYGVAQPNVGYVPDSFGHIEQMPQILQGFGIENYLFSRGEPLAGRGEYLEFNWEAPDGRSRVRAHVLPGGYFNACLLEPVTNPDGLKRTLEAAITPYREHSAAPDLALLCNGIDHIWVQRDLPDILEKARELFPNDEFIHGTLSDYLDAFAASPTAELPTRTGPLHGSHLTAGMLHGTWSSRVDNKQANARACWALENLAEPLSVVAGVFGAPNRHEERRLAWRWVLQNHAHDSICGCSLDRVHRDVNQRFTHAIELAEMVAGEALESFQAPHDDTPSLVRYAGLGGAAGCVEFLLDTCAPGPFHLQDGEGRRYPVQVLATRQLVKRDVVRQTCVPPRDDTRFKFWEVRALAQLPDAPPCAIEKYRLVEGEEAVAGDTVTTAERSMENALLHVEAKENGTITVLHKPTGRVYQGLLALTDEADCGGGYIFTPLEGDEVLRSDTCRAAIARTADGPLRGELVITYDWQVPAGLINKRTARQQTMATCQVETRIALEAGSEMLDCHTRFRNMARDHRVRLALPVPIVTSVANTERAFTVARENMNDYTADPGQHQHPMRNWVSVSDDRGGVAFVGHGLHEYSLTSGAPESELAITLLRAVPFVFDCGTWETPDAQLQGELAYAYALIFHAGDWRAGKIAKRAAQFVHRGVAEIFGADHPAWEGDPHASIWLGEIQGDDEYPVDTHRSSWRTYFSHRDGWRRDEPGRIPHETTPQFVHPISLEDDQMVVSALKQAERDPDGGPDTTGDWIVRLWCVGDSPTASSVTFGVPVEAAWISNMAEECVSPVEIDSNRRCTIQVVPFEVLTLRVRIGSLLSTIAG